VVNSPAVGANRAAACIPSWLPQQSKVQGKKNLGVSIDACCFGFRLRHGANNNKPLNALLP
jgi:hypothetical protein